VIIGFDLNIVYKENGIKVSFQRFYRHFSYLELEQAIDCFSILGGMKDSIVFNYFDDIFSMVKSNFVENFSTFQNLISPSYLLESPYREILVAVARGDGKFYSVLKKARLSESVYEISRF
jgi:hypothetical protein